MGPRLIFNIQYLRGIAALAVLLFHMRMWETKAFPGAGILPDAFAVGNAGVDLFFVISGFIMVFIKPIPIRSFLAWRTFLSDRLSRIYPPFWIVTLGILPLWIARPEMFNNGCDNHMDVARSFLLIPQEYPPLLPVGWTLIHEVYFYLIVSLGLLLKERGRWIFGFVWFFAVALGFIAISNNVASPSPIARLVFSPFSLTFLLGYFIGLIHPLMSRIPYVACWGILFFGICTLTIGQSYNPGYGVYPDNNTWLRFIGYGIPCSVIVAAAVALQHYSRPKFISMVLLGDASYAIYLIHLPIIAAIYSLASKLQLGESTETLLAFLSSLFSCLVLAIFFHIMIERRIIKLSRSVVRRIMRCPPVTSE